MKMLLIAIGLLLSMNSYADSSLIHPAMNLWRCSRNVNNEKVTWYTNQQEGANNYKCKKVISTPRLDCNPYIDQSVGDFIQCSIYDADSAISNPDLHMPAWVAFRSSLEQLLAAVKAHKVSNYDARGYYVIIGKTLAAREKEIDARLANSPPPIIYESPVYAQPTAPAQPPAQTPRSITCNKIGNITTCDTY